MTTVHHVGVRRSAVGLAALSAALVTAFGTSTALEAQAIGTIRGMTVDTATNEPLGDVDVVVRGTSIGVSSGSAGVFLLPRVPAGAQTLVVSRVGYATEERPVDVVAGDTLQLRVALSSAPVVLEELAVTAEAEETQVRESPFSVTVIDGQRLAGRGLTLDEALQRVTGVQIRRSGGLGSASIFNIRGLEGQRVQIYIDGNAADVAGDAFSLDDIPLQLVERVEVYKGVVPARFGGDGLGAAINVVTIHPEGGYLDVGYSAGSYGQHQVSATAKRRLGSGLEGALSVNLDRAENDYTMESPFLEDVHIRRDHNRFERLVVGGSLTTDRLWFDDFEMEGAYIASRRELQGIQTNVQHARTHSGFGVVVLDGEATGRLGGRLDLRVGGAFVSTRSGLTDTSAVRYTFDGASYPSPNGRGELSVLPSDSDNRTTLFRHRTTATYRFAREHIANLTYVLDWSRYRPRDPVANRHAGRNVSEFPGDQSSAVAGLSHEWRPWGERFVNVLGVRGYAFRSKGTPSNLNDPTAERPPEVRNSTVTAGASEAVRYRLTPTLLAKASVEWARRLPTSSELFGDGLLVTAAPGLRPERSLNFNLGLQYDRTFDDGRRVQAEVNGFWMDLRDMIRLAQGFAGLAAYTNQGAARIRGAEAELRADVTRWLHGAASLTYQDARDVLAHSPGTSVPNPTHGLRLPHMPWLFGTALVETHANDLLGGNTRSRLFSEALFTDEYFYAFEVSNRQERRVPRSLTIGLGIEHAWVTTGFTVSAEVQNLTDAMVLNQFNSPLPGRTFRFKVRYTRIDDEDGPPRPETLERP